MFIVSGSGHMRYASPTVYAERGENPELSYLEKWYDCILSPTLSVVSSSVTWASDKWVALAEDSY